MGRILCIIARPDLHCKSLDLVAKKRRTTRCSDELSDVLLPFRKHLNRYISSLLKSNYYHHRVLLANMDRLISITAINFHYHYCESYCSSFYSVFSVPTKTWFYSYESVIRLKSHEFYLWHSES